MRIGARRRLSSAVVEMRKHLTKSEDFPKTKPFSCIMQMDQKVRKIVAEVAQWIFIREKV